MNILLLVGCTDVTPTVSVLSSESKASVNFENEYAVGSKKYIPSNSTKISFNAPKGATEIAYGEGESCDNLTWQPKSDSYSMNLSEGSGAKTISYRYKINAVEFTCKTITIYIAKNTPTLPPTLTLTTPSSSPGNNKNPTITASGILNDDEIKIYNDATCTSLAKTVTANSTSQQITIPLLAVDGNYSFYATSTSEGVTSVCSSELQYTLDITAPTVNLTGLNGGIFQGGTTQTLSWIATDTLAIGATSATIYYSTDNGATWSLFASNQPTSGSYYWVLPTSGNSYRLKITATDVAGNSNSVVSLPIVIDNTPPTITWVSPQTDLSLNLTTTASWKITDANTAATDNTVLSISLDGGTTYTTASTQIMPVGSASDVLYAYTWTTPSVISNVVFKVSATDAAGNVSVITKSIVIAPQRPTITAVTVANGSAIVSLASVNTVVSTTPATNTNLPLAYMRFAESDFDVNTDNGSGWVPYSPEGISYALVGVPGDHTVYAQVKDTSGTLSLTRMTTVKLEAGSPPVINVTAPVTSSTYTPGQTMNISWTCTSSSSNSPLSTSPISSIQYTIDDGLNYHVITDSSQATLAASGSYAWTIPALTPTGATISATTPIRVLVACKTEGGQTATALSALQNTTWQVLIGDPGNMDVGVHLNSADISTWNGVFSDTSSNLYSGSKFRHGIFKVDNQTGMVSNWLGDIFTADCPTATTAKFTIPRIIDITNGEMTIVSGPCHTITRVRISDKAILWNRTVAEINSDDRAAISYPVYDSYIKSGYYYFASYHSGLVRAKAYYELDLNNTSSTPKLVIGSETDCSSTAATVGQVADTIPLTCTNDYTGWIAPLPDRSKVYIYYRTSATTALRYELTRDTGTGKWTVSAAASSISSLCSRTIYMGSDTSKYFCMQNARSGNVIGYTDTSTGNYGGLGSSVSTTTMSDINAFLGSSNNSIYVLSPETNELIEVKFNQGTYTSAKIGGTPYFNYGNGSDPKKVAFTSISGLAYDSTNNYLYTRGIRHIRRMKIDTTTTPSVPFISLTDTAYPSLISAMSNTFGGLYSNHDGSKIIMNTGSTAGYRWEGNLLSSTIWPEGTDQSLTSMFYAHSGTSGAPPTLGTAFSWSSYLIWDWGSTATYSANDNFYFTGYSNSGFTQDLAIFKADPTPSSTSIVAIAGKSGASGSTTFTDGATALGVGFSRIYGMQEDGDGELLVYDGSRVVMITTNSEPTNPHIYLRHDLTTFTNYPSGKTWIDAVHDNSTGWNYFLANDISTGVTNIYAAHNTAKVFIEIPTTGLMLPGTKPGNRGKAFYMKITPLGLLLLDSYKRRILVTPLKT